MYRLDLSPEEYAVLVEQAPILIWRAGTDAKCNYLNQRWLEFTGPTLEQEVGDGWAEGVHPDDFDRCLQTYIGHFERHASFEMEYRLRRHDGEFRWIFDRGVPFFTEGEFAGFIGSCVDVHEAREAREELKRRREEQIQVLESLLPLCMYCKRVRDDQGYWGRLEAYFESRGDPVFTHSLCPQCEGRALDELGLPRD